MFFTVVCPATNILYHRYVKLLPLSRGSDVNMLLQIVQPSPFGRQSPKLMHFVPGPDQLGDRTMYVSLYCIKSSHGDHIQ